MRRKKGQQEEDKQEKEGLFKLLGSAVAQKAVPSSPKIAHPTLESFFFHLPLCLSTRLRSLHATGLGLSSVHATGASPLEGAINARPLHVPNSNRSSLKAPEPQYWEPHRPTLPCRGASKKNQKKNDHPPTADSKQRGCMSIVCFNFALAAGFQCGGEIRTSC